MYSKTVVDDVDFNLTAFIAESLKIEGIDRLPTPEEIHATEKFLDANEVTIESLSEIIHVFAPHNLPRFSEGMNVIIGGDIPPTGGVFIKCYLESLLGCVNTNEIDAFTAHARYEWLHPFTDGNGRSGRALWLWLMQKNQRVVYNSSFLHTFYYQTLSDYKNRLSSNGDDLLKKYGAAA